MNADELRNHLQAQGLEDSWWVVQNGAWLESLMSIAQIEQLDGEIKVLHETQGNDNPPPTIDFQRKPAGFKVAKKAAAPSSKQSAQEMMDLEQREFIIKNKLFPAKELNDLTYVQADALIKNFENKGKKEKRLKMLSYAGVFLLVCGLIFGYLKYLDAKEEEKKKADLEIRQQAMIADQAEYDGFDEQLQEYKVAAQRELQRLVSLETAIKRGVFDEMVEQSIRERALENEVYEEEEYDNELDNDDSNYGPKKYSGTLYFKKLEAYTKKKMPQIYVLKEIDEELYYLLKDQTEYFQLATDKAGDKTLREKWGNLRKEIPVSKGNGSPATRSFAEDIARIIRTASLEKLDVSINLIRSSIKKMERNQSEGGKATYKWAKSRINPYVNQLEDLFEEYKKQLPENRMKKWEEFYNDNTDFMENNIKATLEKKIAVDEGGHFEISIEDEAELLVAVKIGRYNFYVPLKVSVDEEMGDASGDMASVKLKVVADDESPEPLATEEQKEQQSETEQKKQQAERKKIEELRNFEIKVEEISERAKVLYNKEFEIGGESAPITYEVPQVYSLYCTIKGNYDGFYLIATGEFDSSIEGQVLNRDLYPILKYSRGQFEYPRPDDLDWDDVR